MQFLAGGKEPLIVHPGCIDEKRHVAKRPLKGKMKSADIAIGGNDELHRQVGKIEIHAVVHAIRKDGKTRASIRDFRHTEKQAVKSGQKGGCDDYPGHTSAFTFGLPY